MVLYRNHHLLLLLFVCLFISLFVVVDQAFLTFSSKHFLAMVQILYFFHEIRNITSFKNLYADPGQ